LVDEIFRSLFFLSPEAFVDTLSGSFPHLGSGLRKLASIGF
jgi:hypothetical protein